MNSCSVTDCEDAAKSRGLCNKHYLKFWKYGDATAGKTFGKRGHGFIHQSGYLMVGNKFAHVSKVESILGRELPPEVVVHHWDHDGMNNANENLVVCPDQAYHMLLHRRERAFDACGNANYRWCHMCKSWGDPSEMVKAGNGHSLIHPGCRAVYLKNWKLKQKGKSA
jgi:hypothetical protein